MLLTQKCTELSARGQPSLQLQAVSQHTQLTHLELAMTHPPDADSSLCRAAEGCIISSLTALQQLQDLTLDDVTAGSAAYSSLAHLPALRDVRIMFSGGTTQSFSWLTQITSLDCICWNPTIELPQGNHISLQRLFLTDPCSALGLASATQLTFVELTDCDYSQGRFDWPVYLPYLKEITLDCVELEAQHAILQTWMHYLALRTSSIPAANMPTWFTVLQQLTSLRVDCLGPPMFPASMSKLCGLERLALYELQCDLTHDIVGFAKLPQLSFLSFGMSDDEEYSDDITEDDLKLFIEQSRSLTEEEEHFLSELEDGLKSRKVPMTRSKWLPMSSSLLCLYEWQQVRYIVK